MAKFLCGAGVPPAWLCRRDACTTKLNRDAPRIANVPRETPSISVHANIPEPPLSFEGLPMNTTPHKPGAPGAPPASKASTPIWPVVRSILKPIASLKLTVVLFVLGILLIFFGTLAQLDYGIWTVVDKYFYSWVVMVPFDLINKFGAVFWKEQFSDSESWDGSFPLPGGKLLGVLMLINLLAAHAVLFGDAISAAIRQSSQGGAFRKVAIAQLKRTGIYLIHGGLLLLFAGEFITREYAVEQRMSIEQGTSVDYAEDTRNVEVAIVDRSNPNKDTVVVIPQNMLKQKGRIKNDDLPFDVDVIEYMPNSTLSQVKPGISNPADKGLGTMFIATKVAEVSGVDPNNSVDIPSVYVCLYKKNTDEKIGTYLTSLGFRMMVRKMDDDQIEFGDKKYDISLRFQRYYKPYRIHLDKFSFDRYTGTQKAKNYSSDVRIQDAAGNDIFPYHIAMNEPLRYEGETFYQSSFDRTETATILQVVKNPGWLLPYIACVVVGFGLLLHFLIKLIPFLVRSAPARAAAAAGATPPPPTTPVDPEDYFANNAPPTGPSAAARFFPYVVLGIVVLYLLSSAMRGAPPKQPLDYDAASRMRVHDGGRVKPLDTFARVHLRIISGREEVIDDKGNKIPAIRWYLDSIATGNPEQKERGAAWDYKIFRIDNEHVLNTLKLEKREGYRYSMNELLPKFDLLQRELNEIRKKVDAGQKLNTDQTKFKELHDRIETYLNVVQLGGSLQDKHEGLLLLPPYGGADWASLRKYRDTEADGNLAVGINEARPIIATRVKNLTDEDVRRVLKAIDPRADNPKPDTIAETRERLAEVLSSDPARIPQPRIKEVWLRTAFLLMNEEEAKQVNAKMDADMKRRLESHPTAATWTRLITAYRENRPNDFAREVEEYNRLVNTGGVPDTKTGQNWFARNLYIPFNSFGENKVEITYNRFAPFYQTAGLYVLVFILSIVSFVLYVAKLPYWAKSLRWSAILVVFVAGLVHLVGLLTRMYIMDRPFVFVTNLYSSGIFIAFMGVLLCLSLEAMFRIGVANAIGGLVGVAATIVAHNVATDDPLEMMQAVLDTNFWLATHVTTITFGYAATLVAGFFGALYVSLMLATVIRDSYRKVGEPTVGELLAFGTAAIGVVGIPIGFLGFVTSALDKFEVAPSGLLWTFFGLVAAAGVIYSIVLMLTRVGSPGVDSHGKPLVGEIPKIAKPVTTLAMTPEVGKILAQIVYGVVCFATLLSFVGTVLGGIWADQSWGRFWGWDPKENGAVLIVLWNSLILHARWAGLVKDRGVAMLAIFGNTITAWSWFGTNQLGLGLHAYGFDSRLADGCFNFWISQLFIVTVGVITHLFWTRATRTAGVAAAVAPVSAPGKPAASATPPKPPTPSQNGNASTNGAPHTNGHANGHPNGNGQPNGHPKRDKKKRHGKK
jgi:ABC-type transport system involved in cytochrome c biogenesis permease subunit